MASVVDEAPIHGFRGGLAARRNPLEFGEEQWAKLKGFVLEDGAVLRSQWPVQHIAGIGDVRELGVYDGPGETPFLVVVLSDGNVWFRETPPDDAEYDSDEMALPWYPLLDEAGNHVPAIPGLRPLTTVPIPGSKLQHADGGGLVPVLVMNAPDLPDDGRVWFVYEASTPTSADGSDRLRARRMSVTAKWPVDDDTDASPKAGHGVMWSSVLILGDIEWRDNPDLPLSESNKRRYRNGLWFSIPGDVLRFDPLNVMFVGDADERISGLVPIDAGLLVFTTALHGRGGVYLLRGTPDAFVLEPLHVGVGASEGSALWQHTATACWVTEHGEVWQTDTEAIVRLDSPNLGTDRQRHPYDGVADFGPWLLVGREGRLFSLRALDARQGAAWTELNVDDLPGVVDMRTAIHDGQSLYFVAGRQVHRITRADIRTGQTERGRTPAGLAPLSVGTRTLSTGEGHNKTYWHRVGVRATAGYRADHAEVDRLLLRGGPVLDPRAPYLERVGPFSLLEEHPDIPQPPAGREQEVSGLDGWQTIAGAWSVLDGSGGTTSGSTGNVAVMDKAVSTDDHYVQADIDTNDAGGCVVRNPHPSIQTYYVAGLQTNAPSGQRRVLIHRVVDGASTNLANVLIPTPTVPVVFELRSVGPVIIASIDGEEVLRAVDTTISGGRYVGIAAWGSGVSLTDVEGGRDIPATHMMWEDDEPITWGDVQAEWGARPTPLPPPTHSGKRWQALVRAIGASLEFSVEAVFRGDVQVEQVSVFFQGSIRGGNSEGR